MRTKIFKPGDRVTTRNDQQIMMVNKYVLRSNPFIGKFLSDTDVECIWYEEGNRKSKIFDQRALVKTDVLKKRAS